MKRVFLIILLIVTLITPAIFAKAVNIDINRVKFYITDNGYTGGPQFPQDAGGKLNDSFPTPGGRTYAFAPLVFWGNGINEPGSPATPTNIDVSEEIAYEAGNYVSGAFVSGPAWENGALATDYVINTFDGQDYTLNNVAQSTEEGGGWYLPSQQGSDPNNDRWPYNPKKYAYTPSSFKPYESSSDAYLNSIPGSGAFDLYVEDESMIDSLKDYILVYESSEFHVYEVIEYNETETGWEPVYDDSTEIDSFTPDTPTSIAGTGIHINVGSGNATPLSDGDSYLIQGTGVISDQDLVIPFTDNQLLADGDTLIGAPEKYENLGVVALFRAYAWKASYIDTVVVFDITFDNQSTELSNAGGRDYDYFAAGANFYVGIGDSLDDAVKYFEDENLVMIYDYNGEDDSDTLGVDEDVQWNTGDFGQSPYAMIGVKIMQPLSKVTSGGEVPSTRMTLKQSAYPQEYFSFQNGATDPTAISGCPKDFMWIVDEIQGDNADAWYDSMNFYHESFGGLLVRDDGSWQTGFWGNEDAYDALTAGYVSYFYEPELIEDPTRQIYTAQDRSARKVSGPVTIGWYLGDQGGLAQGEKAHMRFAMYAAAPNSWGWSTPNEATAADPVFQKVKKISTSIDALQENFLSPALVPIDPMITHKGTTEYFDFENEAVEIRWKTNSETSFLADMGEAYKITSYRIQQYTGQQYENSLKLHAGTHPNFVEGYFDIYTAVNQYFDFFFDVEESDPTILWATSDLLGYIVEESSDVNYRLGFKFTDTTYTELYEYIYVEYNKTFGYNYKYILQSEDTVGNLSSASGNQAFEVVPAAEEEDTISAALNKVTVVPNPLFVGTRWDKYKEISEVKFNHVPGECLIKIFNVNGELLKQIEHNNGKTYASWDLLTKYQQEVASGLYIYVVEGKNGQKTKGTFSIIR